MSTPQLTVKSVRKIVDDGSHNAFTAFCRFQDTLYLAYRSCPDGHRVHPTSSIVIRRSTDGGAWQEIHRFSVAARDVRDPHFLVFQDKLFVYTGCWLCPEPGQEPEFNEHCGYAVWSDDGREWHGPVALAGTYHHFIWAAGTDGERAYLCGRRRVDMSPTSTGGVPIQSVMLVSEDGLTFAEAGRFAEEDGNETAFLFEEDGSVLALVRSRSPQATLCRSKSPFEQWERIKLTHNIGGPMIVRWGDHTLVGGRLIPIPEDGPKMTLFWLKDNDLEVITELPSGGDCSYPGFVQISEKRALLSYYSSHEGSGGKLAPCAIYLAELELS